MGSSDVEISPFRLHPFLSQNGQSHEGNGSDESDEGDEEEGSEQDCQEQERKAGGFNGTKEKTMSGLKKSDLIKSKSGKIVSKKQSANGKKAYAHIKGWTVAVQKARKALGVKGFV